MKINRIGSKILIPTIIKFNYFIGFYFWDYEIIIYEKVNRHTRRNS